MNRASAAQYLGIPVSPTTQGANQADGKTPLHVVGEAGITFTRDSHEFLLEALVVETLDVDVLAGVPFMHTNDVTVRIRFGKLILSDGTRYLYQDQNNPNDPREKHSVRRTQSHVLPVPQNTTIIWPGE